MSIANLRREYSLQGLRRKDLAADPVTQFQQWFEEARAAGALEPNAMTLATVDAAGQPSSRTVLLKGVDGRGFSFFTNHESRKARELAGNPKAALTFFWAAVERQVCVRGACARLSEEEAEAYFAVRPPGSQWGAWVSRQTEAIPSREFLEERLKEVMARFPEGKVPMPSYWGGYVLTPTAVEFWQGRQNRLHDRFLYSSPSEGVWKIERLSP